MFLKVLIVFPLEVKRAIDGLFKTICVSISIHNSKKITIIKVAMKTVLWLVEVGKH